MISSLIAGIVLWQPQDTPRDIKLPVMPVWQLGNWLEEQTGRDVIVLPQVQDKLVYINVKQRTLPELYGFLGQALGIEVLDRNGVLTVRELPGRTAVGEMTAQGLQASIDKLPVKPYSEQEIKDALPTFKRVQEIRSKQGLRSDDPIWKEYLKMAAMDPMRVGINQFCRSVGGQMFSTLPLYEQVVFSTAPTRMQRAWPGDAKRFMTELTNSMEVRNQVVSAAKEPEQDRGVVMYSDMRSSSFEYIAGGHAQPIYAMTAKVQRMPYGVMVMLSAYDEKGDGIVQTQVQLTDVAFENMQQTMASLQEQLSDLDREYELSEAEDHESKKLMAFFGGGNPATTMTREDIEWLASVDQNEPMGGVVSRMFDFAVEQAGTEMVTEVIMPFQFSNGRKAVKANEILAILCSQSYTKVANPVRGGITLGNPAPDWLRQFLVSRRSIAAMARKVLEHGRLTLDDLADGVMKLSSRDEMMLFVPAALTLSGQSNGNIYLQPRDWKEFLLIAYANLNSEQKKAVFSEQGLEIDINRTIPAIRDAFWASARSSDSRLARDYEEVNGEFREVSLVGGVELTDWLRQPSVFLTLPNTVPVTIRLTGSNIEGLLISQTYRQPGGQSFDSVRFEVLSNYASNQAWMELSPPSGEYIPPVVNGIAPSTQLSLSMTIKFGDFSIDPSTFEMLGAPVGKMLPESELPKETRDKIEAIKAKIRTEQQQYRRGNPPPPLRRK